MNMHFVLWLVMYMKTSEIYVVYLRVL